MNSCRPTGAGIIPSISWGTPRRNATSEAVQVAMAAPELSGLVIILSPQAMTDPTGVARAVAPEIRGQGPAGVRGVDGGR